MKVDYFQPYIISICILIFLIMGYIGSFNYRFENPLSSNAILTIISATIIFTLAILLIEYKIKVTKIKNINILSEKQTLALVLIALFLQSLNLILIGGIPLFNSVLKSNATTNIWRVAYPLFLIMINILLAKYYSKKYLLLVLLGGLIFGLNGYRTSVLGILLSSFITLYYLKKISKKIAIIFISIIIIGIMAIGYITSQSIAAQHWTLNPLELIFYRAAFTLEVFEKIIPLEASTHGHILSMIFSPESPRTFIGEYVLHYNVCLTSTMFGPAYLDFGIIGLAIQMFIMGAFLELVYKIKKDSGIGIYSIILTHTLIWIETGPTDIMIWFLYLLGFLLILINIKNIRIS